MTAAAASTAELVDEIARLQDENARLRAMVSHLCAEASAGYSRGRIRASYHGDTAAPIFGNFGVVPVPVPLDI